MKYLNIKILLLICSFTWLVSFEKTSHTLGKEEAIRVYVEFADGTNRGMYDEKTQKGGFLDESYDATTAMVINWHKMPEGRSEWDAKIQYRKEYPNLSDWETEVGISKQFWFREERINRIVITQLDPNSIYAFRVKENGNTYRFRTMPSSLEERDVNFVIASDHQSPEWNSYSHKNSQMIGLLKPDFFLALGDYVNCSGQLNSNNAARWALYLDNLYNITDGYFIYDTIVEDRLYENVIIPHISILGNHEIGDKSHIRWPADIITQISDLDYPKFTAANWMELLFHFPYMSEGFYSEFRPDHPNINTENIAPGYGHGGFGKLSFSNYLLLIALDNNQNWEGEPDKGLRDWQGNLITDTWPWFEANHSDIRQDIWLKNLLEPENEMDAQEKYQFIIPVWHRGLLGSARFNMSYKNRGVLQYWLPILYRSGVKFFAEAHDHLYGRSIPLGIYREKPSNTYIEKIYYAPLNWEYSPKLDQSYIDDFFSINCLKDMHTHEIVGWEYNGSYIFYEPTGMRSFGYGGWAARRRQVGERGAGNAGWWFVDPDKGGEHFSGEESYHINLIHLTSDKLTSKAYNADQYDTIKQGKEPIPIHVISWDNNLHKWSDQ